MRNSTSYKNVCFKNEVDKDERKVTLQGVWDPLTIDLSTNLWGNDCSGDNGYCFCPTFLWNHIKN